MDLETTMQEQDNKASYKYLGVEEGHQIYHEKMSKRITKEHLHRTMEVMFSPPVCPQTDDLKKLWMDFDEIYWQAWLCDKDEMIRFW